MRRDVAKRRGARTSKGAGPRSLYPTDKAAGGSLQPTGPRLRPTSTGPAPLLACRAEVLRPRPSPIAIRGPTARDVRARVRSAEDHGNRRASWMDCAASIDRGRPRRSRPRRRGDVQAAGGRAASRMTPARARPSPAFTGRGKEARPGRVRRTRTSIAGQRVPGHRPPGTSSTHGSRGRDEPGTPRPGPRQERARRAERAPGLDSCGRWVAPVCRPADSADEFAS
jgi:hypothetical protein